MADEKYVRTSVSLRMDKSISAQWGKIPNNSAFTGKLIEDYLNGKLVSISLPNDIAEKFKECETKEMLISRLLIEYYNDNILFIDDFIKVKKLNQLLGKNSDDVFSQIDKKDHSNVKISDGLATKNNGEVRPGNAVTDTKNIEANQETPKSEIKDSDNNSSNLDISTNDVTNNNIEEISISDNDTEQNNTINEKTNEVINNNDNNIEDVERKQKVMKAKRTLFAK